MVYKISKRLSFLFIGLSLVGCRGQKSEQPPLLPVQNMYDQTSYGPQSKNGFYADRRATRPALEGTVAQGEAREDSRLYEGLEPGSSLNNPVWVKQIPISLNDKTLARGQTQYNIYCSPCHGYAGNSDGLVTLRAGGTIRPANLHDPDKINMPVGQVYSAVHNGVNNWNMPGFSEQMDVMDRWAVVAYVKALQLAARSQIPSHPTGASQP